MVDLTTLEGADTPGKVRSLCAKALRPDPDRPDLPAGGRGLRLSATWSPVAVEALAGSGVHVAAVATAFPSGRRRLAVKLADTAVGGGRRRRRDRHGDRPRRLPGRPLRPGVRRDRRGQAGLRATPHLKVILETGELATYDNVRRASWLALLAGGDFIKTSTGKISPAATLPVTHVMLQAVRDLFAHHRRAPGGQAGRRHPEHQGRHPATWSR